MLSLSLAARLSLRLAGVSSEPNPGYCPTEADSEDLALVSVVAQQCWQLVLDPKNFKGFQDCFAKSTTL